MDLPRYAPRSRVLAVCLAIATVVLSCKDKSPTGPGPFPLPSTPVIDSPGFGACILVGQSVTYLGHIEKPTGMESLRWTFDGGQPAEAGDTTEVVVTYPKAGTYQAVLETVQNGQRLRLDVVWVHVKLSCDPVTATITVPSSPPTIQQGDAIAFTGVCSGGQPPRTASWTFGDPAIPNASGLTPTVVFPNPGDFQVVLTCTDSLFEKGRDTLAVHVWAAVSIPTGLFTIPVTNPDGMGVISLPVNGGWGPLPYSTTPVAVGIAGSNGVDLFNPLAPGAPVASPFRDGTATIGAEPIRYGRIGIGPTSAPLGGIEGDALFRYGSGAVLTPWDPMASQWSAFSLTILSTNLVIDGVPYAGDEASGGLLAIAATRIEEVEYDPKLPGWTIGDDFFNRDLPFGSFASAFARDPAGSMLIVADGSPGQLYLHDRTPGHTARPIGSVGNSPRRLRCSGNVCVVSNFASNDLTIARWDAATDSVSITATVPVGNGPIGIDLLDLPSGDVAIVSTGFSDNTFSVTVVSPQGQVVSNTTKAVDAGCGSPGHAIWLRDAGRHVLITCNATGNIQIVASGL